MALMEQIIKRSEWDNFRYLMVVELREIPKIWNIEALEFFES